MNMTNWVGQTIGQYRIEAPLDAGSMGQVFSIIWTGSQYVMVGTNGTILTSH